MKIFDSKTHMFMIIPINERDYACFRILQYNKERPIFVYDRAHLRRFR